MTTESQCKKLADHIMKGNGVSSMLAFKMFGVTSLHRRLYELRESGIPVDEGTWSEHGGKRFKVYRKNETLTKSRKYFDMAKELDAVDRAFDRLKG